MAQRRLDVTLAHLQMANTNASETWGPDPEFSKASLIGSEAEYQKMWQRSIRDPDGFWGEIASTFSFYSPWNTVMKSDLVGGNISWFGGAKLNVSVNCLDRHVDAGHGERPALTFEADDGQNTTLTYTQLLAETCRMANCLRAHGVKKGDVVTIYMPMVMNLGVACLACARIGAIHNGVIWCPFAPLERSPPFFWPHCPPRLLFSQSSLAASQLRR